jgi:hypothetical protein
MVAGQRLTWRVKQDAIGGRPLTFGAAFTWEGGVAPTISSAASSVTIIEAVTHDGATLYGHARPGYPA